MTPKSAAIFLHDTAPILRQIGQHGGPQTGYQFEHLASDLMVKLGGRFLADHKEIFNDPQRRADLVETLEVFVAAS